MEDRIALVTGASSGIGARTAQMLVERGLRVYGAARRTDAVARTAGVIPVELDLTNADSIERAVEWVEQHGGAIDILINCAGYGEFGAVEDTAMARARRQLEVNVLGTMDLTRRVLPGMRAKGAGRIVNVSSLAGEFASPLGGWYHASKFALEALSDSLRGEVAQFGIDVALVQPSYVDTDWHDLAMEELAETSGSGEYAAMADAMRTYFASDAVGRQMSDVKDVAATVVTAALAPRPKTRYRVGKGAQIAVALATLLPDRTFDKLTRAQFGYDRRPA